MKKFCKIIISLTLVLALSSCSSITGRVSLSKEEYQEYLKNKEIIDKVKFLEGVIDDNYLFDYNKEDLESGIYKGIFEALDDPYSQYFTEEEFKSLIEQTDGKFGGIGIVVTAADDGYLTVVSPIKDTPADKAGIKSGDRIVKIEGQEFTAKEMEAAVKLMKGEAGTDVNVTFSRKGEGDLWEDFEKKITREIIKIDSVLKKDIDDYSYILISSFEDETDEDFKKAMEEAKDKKGVIIDLRNNPGGRLDTVVNIADYLLKEGPIVYTVDKKGKEEVENSDKNMNDMPLVVLVNGASASASEILAGSIKDYKRGEIIGETTFGKGIVQRLFPVANEGFKLTVSEYFTPKKNKIHKKGVNPDIEVKLNDGVERIGIENLNEDNQLQKQLKF